MRLPISEPFSFIFESSCQKFNKPGHSNFIACIKIKLITFNQTITDASIRNIAMRCPKLRQLCVSKCGELTDSTLLALANYNPRLSTLEVAGCHQFTDIGFQALGKVRQEIFVVDSNFNFLNLLF